MPVVVVGAVVISGKGAETVKCGVPLPCWCEWGGLGKTRGKFEVTVCPFGCKKKRSALGKEVSISGSDSFSVKIRTVAQFCRFYY